MTYDELRGVSFVLGIHAFSASLLRDGAEHQGEGASGAGSRGYSVYVDLSFFTSRRRQLKKFVSKIGIVL